MGILSFFLSFSLSIALLAQAPTLVFVHLGPEIPSCILTVIEQARFLNEESDIYLLVDSAAYLAFEKEYQAFFVEKKISLVNTDWVPVTEEHLSFCRQNEVGRFILQGFQLYTLERFFYLFDFISWKKLKKVVHLESDCMLYVDLTELEVIWEQSLMGAPFISKVASVPCFVFIKDARSLQILMHYILSSMSLRKINDMEILASFYKKLGRSYFLPLPTLMDEYRFYHLPRKSLFLPDRLTSLDFLSDNCCLFSSYLFDAATLGIFLNGNNRNVFPKNGPGTVHYRSLFDPHYFSFFWGEDKQKRVVPYLAFKDKEYRIVNMHFHSKKPEKYTSFKKNRCALP